MTTAETQEEAGKVIVPAWQPPHITISDEHKVGRGDRQYVRYAGLIDAFHRKYEECSRGIDTHIEQIPTPDNDHWAYMSATVTVRTPDGRVLTFKGHGDASPNEPRAGTPSKESPLRMAETRAKARALKDAINLPGLEVDETDIIADEQPAQVGQRRGGVSRRQGPQAVPDEPQDEPAPPPDETPGVQRGGARKAQAPPKNAARKSQKDLLRTLAEELRGENGVERLEKRIGKPIDELTRAEADEWIDRLTPAEQRGE